MMTWIPQAYKTLILWKKFFRGFGGAEKILDGIGPKV